MKSRTVGILGGKGPEATVELLRLIIANTPAETEEEHLRVVIDNHPQIPKPALGITGEGPDPVPALTETARNLERAGADFVVIPCNSAHYYAKEVRAALDVASDWGYIEPQNAARLYQRLDRVCAITWCLSRKR